MARLDEIADGIAKVLVSLPEPEPFKVSLWNEGIVEVTFLVRAVIDSCERNGAPLSLVSVCFDLGSDLLKQYGRDPSGYQGVKINGSATLQSEIEFHRFPSAR